MEGKSVIGYIAAVIALIIGIVVCATGHLFWGAMIIEFFVTILSGTVAWNTARGWVTIVMTLALTLLVWVIIFAIFGFRANYMWWGLLIGGAVSAYPLKWVRDRIL